MDATTNNSSRLTLNPQDWRQPTGSRTRCLPVNVIGVQSRPAYFFYFNGCEPTRLLLDLIKSDLSITSHDNPIFVHCGQLYACDEQQQAELKAQGKKPILAPTLNDLFSIPQFSAEQHHVVFTSEPTFAVRKDLKSN